MIPPGRLAIYRILRREGMSRRGAWRYAGQVKRALRAGLPNVALGVIRLAPMTERRPL